MGNGVKTHHTNGRTDDELEPYRRLLELQKQLITLAKKNDEVRLECAALQERIIAELLPQRETHGGLSHRMRAKANLVLERLSKFALE